MKYKNQPIKRIEKVVEIPHTDLKITIHSIPVGLNRRFLAIFPEPKPPVRTTTDAKTGKSTQDVQWYDEEFQKKRAEHNHLSTIYLIWWVIKDDPNLQLETPNIETIELLQRFDKELQDSGFAEGDIAYLLKQVEELSNLNIKEIEKAKEGF